MQLYNLYETNSPVEELTEHELNMIILYLGSFLSIISNKKINQAKLLIITVENKYFRELFQELTAIDNTQLLIRSIIEKFPTISKSKIIIKKLIQ